MVFPDPDIPNNVMALEDHALNAVGLMCPLICTTAYLLTETIVSTNLHPDGSRTTVEVLSIFLSVPEQTVRDRLVADSHHCSTRYAAIDVGTERFWQPVEIDGPARDHVKMCRLEVGS